MDFRSIGRQLGYALSGGADGVGVSFAVAAKSAKGGKSCKKGIPCGGSCISVKKSCRSELPEKTKSIVAAVKETKPKTARAKKTVSHPPNTPEFYITKGRDFLKFLSSAEKKALKESLALSSQYEKEAIDVLKAANKAAKEGKVPENSELMQKGFDLIKKSKETLKQPESVMGKVVERIKAQQGLSDEERKERVKKITATPHIRKTTPGLEAAIENYVALTGHKIAVNVTRNRNRGNANMVKKEVNLGNTSSTGRIIFHEFGHFYEYEKPDLLAAARTWVKQRSEESNEGTAVVESLYRLTKSKFYRQNETAYKDKFIDPYVGKIYAGPHTEVISLGLEHFSSPKLMADLYIKDPEHFELVLGSILP